MPRLRVPRAAVERAARSGRQVPGRNVAIEFRWVQNDINRLPELAADAVFQQVSQLSTAPR
jgi:hypothetical protein